MKLRHLFGCIFVLDMLRQAHPQPLTVDAGNTAISQPWPVVAEPLTYQWRENTVELPGLTNATLAMPGVNPSQAGSSFVLVNDSCTLDYDFCPNLGTNSEVACLALQADGRIVIGGNFGTVNGMNRHALARLNPGDSMDTDGDPHAVCVVGNFVFVADGRNGLVILEAEPPAEWPRLTITCSESNACIRWPASAMDHALESSAELNPTNWSPVRGLPQFTNDVFSVSQPVLGREFYRLHRR